MEEKKFTPFSEIYDIFLTKITDDMYMEFLNLNFQELIFLIMKEKR